MNPGNPLRHSRRSGADWNLFFRAYAVVGFIRLMLWMRPFPKIQSWATKAQNSRVAKSSLDSKAVYKIVWAVSAAARRIPRATCLTQALATQIMLGRRAYATDLHFGAKKNGQKLDAHAWIERNGNILIGFNDTFPDLTHFSTTLNTHSEFHENGG